MEKIDPTRHNCSSYNPCGSHGYCEDDDSGQWTCECKFWWSGSKCEQLTPSGVQVIILGCIVVLLIGIYYGVIIYRGLQRRKQRSTNRPATAKFSLDVPFSIHRSVYLLLCLNLIMTTVALVIKWSIIQPIHNHIIDRYRHNLSLYFTPNRFCHVIDYQHFNPITFSISCALILLFTLEYRRLCSAPYQWQGRFTLPVPVDFFTDVHRTSIAVTFGMCAYDLSVIANNAFKGSVSTDDGIVIVYLRQVFQVLVMGFRYYPILCSIHLDSMLSLVLGVIYTWLEFPMIILEQSMCQPRFYSSVVTTEETFSNILINYYGTGSLLVVIEIMVDVPRYLCLSYIAIHLTKKLIEKYRYRSVSNVREDELWRVAQSNSVQMLYLKNLSRKQSPATVKRWIYEWRPDFRYSSRVLSVYSSIFLFLYVLLVQGCAQFLPYMVLLQEVVQSFLQEFNNKLSDRTIPLFVGPFLASVLIGTLVVVIQLLVLLANIRRNLFQVYRGDDSEIPRRDRSAYVKNAMGNFHFAGYLIGYVLWGLAILIFSLFVLFLIIAALFTFHAVRITESILKYLIPTLLFVLFKRYFNACLARFAFLQDDGTVLAVKNRRLLMIFLYFNFFLDAFLGLFSSLLRLVESVLGGVLYLCRLDHSPLGRKLETWDDGFNAYCGFIHTECTHRHPILLVFAAHLLAQIRRKHSSLSFSNQLLLENSSSPATKDQEKTQQSNRIIRKWQLAAFLVRNPSIVFFRKAYINEFHMFDYRTIFQRQVSDRRH